MRILFLVVVIMISGIFSANVFAQRTVIDVIAHSKDHSFLLGTIKKAGLVETLMGAGPFTILSPTNTAFAKLQGPSKEVVTSGSRDEVAKVVIYNILAGNITTDIILQGIKDGNGKTSLKTLDGSVITATESKGKIILTDERGISTTIISTDIKAGNGLIQVIDNVLMPV
ncbi:MAG: beta-Ig-H3/fasciclin [Chitinophagaceae bacterium]|nr:beta-Ig-H3/fasciclin [Chitinophagaceae bacterium]